MKGLNWKGKGAWDIVTANPPYISLAGFARETEGSVRRWEPRLALVPELRGKGGGDGNKGDTFYPALISLARYVGAKVLLMEVGGTAQARRVVEMVLATGDGAKAWEGVEVWCDGLGDRGFAVEDSTMEREGGDADGNDGDGNGKKLSVRKMGTGHGRAVVCFRSEGAKWFGGGERGV